AFFCGPSSRARSSRTNCRNSSRDWWVDGTASRNGSPRSDATAACTRAMSAGAASPAVASASAPPLVALPLVIDADAVVAAVAAWTPPSVRGPPQPATSRASDDQARNVKFRCGADLNFALWITVVLLLSARFCSFLPRRDADDSKALHPGLDLRCAVSVV